MILHILGGVVVVLWIVLEVLGCIVMREDVAEVARGCLTRPAVALSWLLFLAGMLLGLHALDTLHLPWLAALWWVVCGAALLFGVFQPRIRLRRRRSP
jgi:hypothetical protein